MSCYKMVYFLLLIVIVASCAEIKKGQVLKLAHGLDISHPVHHGMVYMADMVDEKSGGKLKIEIYPSGQLGQERECLELLQIGSLAMTKVSASVMENFAPSYKVLSLPYIFRDPAHSYRVMDGEIGQEILTQGQKFWLRGLTFYDAGYRSFYTKERPVSSPDDLRGLKIRVQPSNTAMNMVRAFGGSPTPISWGELYTALQQGVVDGAENNSPSFYFSRHYEVCKYYSLNEHTAVPDVLLISTVIWKKLSDQEKKWVLEAARESAVYQRKLWQESEKFCLEEVQKAGVEIIYADKEAFASKVQPIYDAYKNDAELYSLIQQIQAIER
jgi:tripartite ATP-independent transporter DctP family solute receptor